MQSIATLLASPEWWFSAVIVAIPVGILGAYSKDWLSAGLAAVSRRYRAYRTKAAAKRATEIELLSGNPDLLIVTYVRVATMVAIWLFMSFSALVLPSLLIFLDKHPEYSPFPRSGGGREAEPFMQALLLATLFFGTLLAQYGATKQLSIAKAAHRRLRNRRRQAWETPPA